MSELPPPPPSQTPAPLPRPGRRSLPPWWAIAAAVIVVIGIIGAIAGTSDDDDPSPDPGAQRKVCESFHNAWDRYWPELDKDEAIDAVIAHDDPKSPSDYRDVLKDC